MLFKKDFIEEIPYQYAIWIHTSMQNIKVDEIHTTFQTLNISENRNSDLKYKIPKKLYHKILVFVGNMI